MNQSLDTSHVPVISVLSEPKLTELMIGYMLKLSIHSPNIKNVCNSVHNNII